MTGPCVEHRARSETIGDDRLRPVRAVECGAEGPAETGQRRQVTVLDESLDESLTSEDLRAFDRISIAPRWYL